MSNYLSDFVRRFSGENRDFAAVSSQASGSWWRPQINYITLFNPSWAPSKDESLNGLLQQVVFFIKPNPHGGHESNEDELEEKLNTIGLIRGSSGLVAELGDPSPAVFIHVSEGLILCQEIEEGYFLAVSVSGRCFKNTSKDVYSKQLEVMVQEWHAMFLLFQSKFEKLRSMGGDSTLKQMLSDHWGSFMDTYNCGSEPAYGPATLSWPNRANGQGFFRFFPENSYKESSIRISDSQKARFHGGSNAILIANLSRDSPKKRGIIHTHCQHSQAYADMRRIYGIFDTLEANGSLDEISPKIQHLFSPMRRRWQREKADLEPASDTDADLDPEDDPNVSTSAYAATMDALHPATITNKLIVSPINETINGFKYFTSAVSDSVASGWFAPREPEQIAEQHEEKQGRYLVGLVNDEITRLLVHIPSREDAQSKEMSVVVYLEEETLVILAYESGMQQLESRDFYVQLQESLLEDIVEATRTHAMANSIGSLRDSIGIEINNGSDTKDHEVDESFFYVVYDLETKGYRSSLPKLPSFLWPQKEETKRSSYKIIFHLHDRLIAHFICKSEGTVFGARRAATESLHKFSSRKAGDWMFYLIRHEKTIIIIVKKSNVKAKPRVTDRQDSYLIKAADTLYGAANLGFFDSLGEDVRIWLGGLSEGKI